MQVIFDLRIECWYGMSTDVQVSVMIAPEGRLELDINTLRTSPVPSPRNALRQ